MSAVVAVRFHETRKCPAGSIAWHPTHGLVDVLRARGWEREVRLGRAADPQHAVADVDVRELELVDLEPAPGDGFACVADERRIAHARRSRCGGARRAARLGAGAATRGAPVRAARLIRDSPRPGASVARRASRTRTPAGRVPQVRGRSADLRVMPSRSPSSRKPARASAGAKPGTKLARKPKRGEAGSAPRPAGEPLPTLAQLKLARAKLDDAIAALPRKRGR